MYYITRLYVGNKNDTSIRKALYQEKDRNLINFFYRSTRILNVIRIYRMYRVFLLLKGNSILVEKEFGSITSHNIRII